MNTPAPNLADKIADWASLADEINHVGGRLSQLVNRGGFSKKAFDDVFKARSAHTKLLRGGSTTASAEIDIRKLVCQAYFFLVEDYLKFVIHFTELLTADQGSYLSARLVAVQQKVRSLWHRHQRLENIVVSTPITFQSFMKRMDADFNRCEVFFEEAGKYSKQNLIDEFRRSGHEWLWFIIIMTFAMGLALAMLSIVLLPKLWILLGLSLGLATALVVLGIILIRRSNKS